MNESKFANGRNALPQRALSIAMQFFVGALSKRPELSRSINVKIRQIQELYRKEVRAAPVCYLFTSGVYSENLAKNTINFEHEVTSTISFYDSYIYWDGEKKEFDVENTSTFFSAVVSQAPAKYIYIEFVSYNSLLLALFFRLIWKTQVYIIINNSTTVVIDKYFEQFSQLPILAQVATRFDECSLSLIKNLGVPLYQQTETITCSWPHRYERLGQVHAALMGETDQRFLDNWFEMSLGRRIQSHESSHYLEQLVLRRSRRKDIVDMVCNSEECKRYTSYTESIMSKSQCIYERPVIGNIDSTDIVLPFAKMDPKASDIEYARKIEASISNIGNTKDIATLRSILIRYYAENNHIENLIRLIADHSLLVDDDFQHILRGLINSNRINDAEAFAVKMRATVKERWDIRLQLARLEINKGHFDLSFSISRDLLLEKKDDPSASGLFILSLINLDRYPDLFEYIDSASDQALSAEWAVFAFVNEYKLSSMLDTSRMFRAIEKISQSHSLHYRLWSVRLKRMAGFLDEALLELKDYGKTELIELDYETELNHILFLSSIIPFRKKINFFKKTAYKDIDEQVDIIVPIYNAYEDTRVCLERLYLYTPEVHRIYLIDDASTDLRIGVLCIDFCKKRANTKIIKQQSNKGFISSVNLGLEQATGHVVLINTDAFVPENWLERILFAILKDRSVASVTPMTNNGTIANVPAILEVRQLTSGVADQVDMIAQQFDPLEVLTEVPTGVGFCMAMSRYWLDRVSRLDTSFGHGYGEEVDWCQRVLKLGGKHILTGGLFVEHRGGMSFGDEKQARIIENNKKISQRYPKYDRAVHEFVKNDPAIASRLALGLAMIGAEGEVPVFLAHRWGGGAELWLKDIIQQRLKDNRSSVVVRGSDTKKTVLIELHSREGITQGNIDLSALNQYIKILPRKELIYSCLVGTENPLKLIDLLLKNMSETDRLRILFHDYFPICPSYTLIGKNKKFCKIPKLDDCEKCFSEIKADYLNLSPSIFNWRSNWLIWLERANAIEVFSHSSLNIILKVWPSLINKVEVKPHKLPFLPAKVEITISDRPVVGILGVIGYQKGAAIIKELAVLAEERLEVVVVGEIDPNYVCDKIKVHGRYTPDMISNLAKMYSINRWFIPSICPETFSFTTHECLATGLPVYGFDIGGQADAIRNYVKGRLISIETNTEQLIDILCE